MRPCLLYGLTAVVLGGQIYVSMMAAVWGVPTSALQYVALLGCGVLLAGAVVALFRARAGGLLATIGLLACWPVCISSLKALASLPSPGRVLVAAVNSAFWLLLVVATGHSLIALGSARIRARHPRWFEAATPMQRRSTAIFGSVTLIFVASYVWFKSDRVSCPEIPWCRGAKLATHSVRWELSARGICSAPGVGRVGEREVKLTFVKFPEHSLTFCSTALARELERARHEPVPALFAYSDDGSCTCRVGNFVPRDASEVSAETSGNGPSPWDE